MDEAINSGRRRFLSAAAMTMTAARFGAVGAERASVAYEKYRYEFAKLIWQIASPKWRFDDATFDQSAKAFDKHRAQSASGSPRGLCRRGHRR